MGFIIIGFIWDIPILVFAYVLFWGPITASKPSRFQLRLAGERFRGEAEIVESQGLGFWGFRVLGFMVYGFRV